MKTKIEYKMEDKDVITEKRLNELGKEGWELIFILDSQNKIIFKRESKEV